MPIGFPEKIVKTSCKKYKATELNKCKQNTKITIVYDPIFDSLLYIFLALHLQN